MPKYNDYITHFRIKVKVQVYCTETTTDMQLATPKAMKRFDKKIESDKTKRKKHTVPGLYRTKSKSTYQKELAM